MTNQGMESALARLAQTDIVRYRYKSASGTGRLRLGFIAEEAPFEMTSDKRDAIDTGDALGYLLACVKALKNEQDQIKSKIEALKA